MVEEDVLTNLFNNCILWINNRFYGDIVEAARFIQDKYPLTLWYLKAKADGKFSTTKKDLK